MKKISERFQEIKKNPKKSQRLSVVEMQRFSTDFYQNFAIRICNAEDLVQECHDCGVLEGQLHEPSCDMERCPICLGQLLTCGHGNKIWTVTATKREYHTFNNTLVVPAVVFISIFQSFKFLMKSGKSM